MEERWKTSDEIVKAIEEFHDDLRVHAPHVASRLRVIDPYHSSIIISRRLAGGLVTDAERMEVRRSIRLPKELQFAEENTSMIHIVHAGNHWSMQLLYVQTPRLIYETLFDSLSMHEHVADLFLDCFQDLRIFDPTELCVANHALPSVVTQESTWECGYYVTEAVRLVMDTLSTRSEGESVKLTRDELAQIADALSKKLLELQKDEPKRKRKRGK